MLLGQTRYLWKKLWATLLHVQEQLDSKILNKSFWITLLLIPVRRLKVKFKAKFGFIIYFKIIKEMIMIVLVLLLKSTNNLSNFSHALPKCTQSVE